MIVTIAGQRAAVDGDRVRLPRCPACGAEPAHARGTGITHHDHDSYYARAVSLCCKQDIGEMRTRVDTIFGIDEDRAFFAEVRARVYGGGRR
jgi:hypothetical protein